MYFSRKCKITFISHGSTIFSEVGRFSDTENYPPLSEGGMEEIVALTKYLKARGVKNDVIYSSSSVRAMQSAEIVSKLFKKDYVVLDELKSRAYGKWNGLTFNQVLDRYPEGFHLLLQIQN